MMEEENNTVSFSTATEEETHALQYALTRLQVCVADSDGLANYPPALLRDDIRLVLAELHASRAHDADQRAALAKAEGENKLLRDSLKECLTVIKGEFEGPVGNLVGEIGRIYYSGLALLDYATPAGEGRE